MSKKEKAADVPPTANKLVEIFVASHKGFGVRSLLRKFGELVKENDRLSKLASSGMYLKFKIDARGPYSESPKLLGILVKSHASILAVDTSKKESVEAARAVMASVGANPRFKGKPMLVLATKRDLDGCVPLSEVEALAAGAGAVVRIVEACGLADQTKWNGSMSAGLEWLLASVLEGSDRIARKQARDAAIDARLAKIAEYAAKPAAQTAEAKAAIAARVAKLSARVERDIDADRSTPAELAEADKWLESVGEEPPPPFVAARPISKEKRRVDSAAGVGSPQSAGSPMAAPSTPAAAPALNLASPPPAPAAPLLASSSSASALALAPGIALAPATASAPVLAPAAPAEPGIEKIDMKLVHTNAAYRFGYLGKFMEFGAGDIAAIKGSAPVLGPLVPGLVDAVYAKLFSFDVTKRYFLPQQDGYTGELPGTEGALTTSHAIIKFRKEKLAKYLVKLVTSEYDGSLVEYVDRVGKLHTRKEGNKNLEIDLVHMNALFGYVNDALIATFQGLSGGVDQATKDKLVRAFTKLLWVQSDFTSRHYTNCDSVDTGEAPITTPMPAAAASGPAEAGVEVIDMKKVHTSSAYRFGYLARFMGMSADDIAVIKASAPVLGPLVPTLVDAVYAKLFAFDVTKRYFMPQQEGYSGSLPQSEASFTLTHEVIKFRKEKLAKYLVKLVTSEYDGSLVEYVDFVGKVHTKKAGNKDLEVDLVHMNALFGYVNDALIATFQGLTNVDQASKDKLIRAFTKLLWIQSDFTSRHYTVCDAAESAPAALPAPAPAAAPAEPGIEKIDMKLVHTNAAYRFGYLGKFMEFGAGDIAAIKGSAPVLGPLVPGLVDAVYAKLFSFDVTKRYFLPQQDGYTGELPGTEGALTTSHAIIKFRKEKLAKYLVKLVTSEYDGSLVEYVDRVGKLHTRKEGNKNLEIDLVHMNALFGYVNDALIATFQGLSGVVDQATKDKLVRAFTKLLWVQSDFTSRHYTNCDSVDTGEAPITTPMPAAAASGPAEAGVEVIDMKKVHTSSAYRFGYLARFMGMSADDIAVIKASAPVLGPLVPTLVDAVYAKLFAFDVTKRYFMPQQEGYSGSLPQSEASFTLTHEVIKFRKEKLAKYLVKLVTSEYDGSLVEYVDFVGKVHTKKAGNKDLEVDLVHMNALFGYVNDALIATFQGLTNVDQASKDKLIRAFTKLLWIQSDFTSRHYTVCDTAESAPAALPAPAPAAAPAEPGIEKIDMKLVHTNAAYRFGYLGKFMEFGAGDIAAIKGSAPVLGPLVPGLVDAVYAKLFSFDVTKRYFLPQQDGYTGELPGTEGALTTSHAIIKFRKEKLAKYLVKLVTSEYDGSLVEYVDRVGKLHTRKEGNKNLEIDLVHMNALFGYATKDKLVRAFTKLLWVQSDFTSRHYTNCDSVDTGEAPITTPMPAAAASGPAEAGVEVIDMKKVHTSSAYRFGYLARFMGMSADDIAVIKASAPVLGPLVPTLVDAVYAKLFAFDVTKRYFMPQQEGYSGSLPQSEASFTLTHEVIKFRKEKLAKYLVKLVTSEYDGSLVEYVDFVGKVHTKKAGNKDLEVDLVHMNALFGYVNDALIATFQGLTNVDQASKDKLIRAFTKLLWIQSDFTSRHYTVCDAAESAPAALPAPAPAAAPAEPGIEKIDMKLVHTNAAYRFGYLGKFMEFGAGDIAAIKGSAPVLGPLVPGLVDAVYAKLFSFDVTKRYFLPQQDGYTGELPGTEGALTTSHAIIKFRKEKLAKYLVKLVTSEYDGSLVEYVDRVGKLHTRKEGNKNLEIDLVHMNALFGYVNDALIATFQGLSGGVDQATKDKLVRAFTKLLWVQSDFTSRHYTNCDSVDTGEAPITTPMPAAAASGPAEAGVEVIDMKKVHTSSAYRFGYLARFMGFSADDIATIKGIAPVLGPLVPTLVDAVYAKLFSFDVTKRYFMPQQEGFSGSLPQSESGLGVSHEVIKFRKEKLTKYLVKLVTAEYDAALVEYVDYVGRIHTKKDGNKSLEIDLVHMNALFGYVNDALIATFQCLPVDQARKDKLVRAFTKLLWIQSDFVSRHYTVCDAAESAPAALPAPAPVPAAAPAATALLAPAAGLGAPAAASAPSARGPEPTEVETLRAQLQATQTELAAALASRTSPRRTRSSSVVAATAGGAADDAALRAELASLREQLAAALAEARQAQDEAAAARAAQASAVEAAEARHAATVQQIRAQHAAELDGLRASHAVALRESAAARTAALEQAIGAGGGGAASTADATGAPRPSLAPPRCERGLTLPLSRAQRCGSWCDELAATRVAHAAEMEALAAAHNDAMTNLKLQHAQALASESRRVTHDLAQSRAAQQAALNEVKAAHTAALREAKGSQAALLDEMKRELWEQLSRKHAEDIARERERAQAAIASAEKANAVALEVMRGIGGGPLAPVHEKHGHGPPPRTTENGMPAGTHALPQPPPSAPAQLAPVAGPAARRAKTVGNLHEAAGAGAGQEEDQRMNAELMHAKSVAAMLQDRIDQLVAERMALDQRKAASVLGPPVIGGPIAMHPSRFSQPPMGAAFGIHSSPSPQRYNPTGPASPYRAKLTHKQQQQHSLYHHANGPHARSLSPLGFAATMPPGS
eukprot:tig00021348_g20525.t1